MPSLPLFLFFFFFFSWLNLDVSLVCACFILLAICVLSSRSTGALDSIDVRADARCASLSQILSLSAERTISSIYPRLFSLHDMSDEVRCTKPAV